VVSTCPRRTSVGSHLGVHAFVAKGRAFVAKLESIVRNVLGASAAAH
jgi:hypothetical protein